MATHIAPNQPNASPATFPQTTDSCTNPATGLWTDLYQLTMAQGHWKLGRHEQPAVFHLFFRKAPFQGSFTLAAGLADAVALLENLGFDDRDLAYLATLEGNDEQPLFDPGFLTYLKDLRWTCDVDAMPEGTVAFANEPLLRIQGPMLQAQLVETALLTVLNFQTLIATKAARMCLAAEGDPVFEFGLRRAQGLDGGLSASRAAYIGGCTGTSNVMAAKAFGIPAKGTHAHSWVMSFDDELEAFDQYAQAMPNNCVFLVDTYDTLQGVEKAIAIGQQMKQRGHRMVGIRLDSGDLAYLSQQARNMLNAAGMHDAQIVASNDLDETIIQDLKRQGAAIDVWAVGTKLVTAFDQPALGGVYKLGAIEQNGQWQHRMKHAEQTAKASIPGRLQVRRYQDEQGFVADMLIDELLDAPADRQIVDPNDANRHKHIPANATHQDLLKPVMRSGQLVQALPDLLKVRAHAQTQLGQLHPTLKRLLNPHQHPVGLASNLQQLRQNMINANQQRVEQNTANANTNTHPVRANQQESQR